MQEAVVPLRISVATLNLWKDERWPERSISLGSFLERFCPDLLCLQELCKETCEFLDQCLSRHNRVHDEFQGWDSESNIYWNADIFEKDTHGAIDVGIPDGFHRLFWVRLRCETNSILVATAQLTWPGSREEVMTGQSPRTEQINRIITCLGEIAMPNRPAFFVGDLNGTAQPIYSLRDAGYTDCFTDLGLIPPPTSPVNGGLGLSPSRTIDWITSNSWARPMAAMVPMVVYDGIPLSDHWPVVAIYKVERGEEC